MMTERNTCFRNKSNRVTIDTLVPNNHLVRKLDKAINLDFIYDEVRDLYSPRGRSSIDPVVLFKLIIIQNIFGIKSMRKTIEEINVNLAYRWYLNYDIDETVPHFGTFSKNYIRRFKDTDIFTNIFDKILQQAINRGFVDTTKVFIDGTHIKANANSKKLENKLTIKRKNEYIQLLDQEIEKHREKNGKKN